MSGSSNSRNEYQPSINAAGLIAQTQSRHQGSPSPPQSTKSPPSRSRPLPQQREQRQPDPNRFLPLNDTPNENVTMELPNGTLPMFHDISMFEPNPIREDQFQVVHGTIPVSDNEWSRDLGRTKEICRLQLQPRYPPTGGGPVATATAGNSCLVKKRHRDETGEEHSKDKKNKKTKPNGLVVAALQASIDLETAYQEFVGHVTPPPGLQPMAQGGATTTTTTEAPRSQLPWLAEGNHSATRPTGDTKTTAPVLQKEHPLVFPTVAFQQQLPHPPSLIPSVEAPTTAAPTFPMMMMMTTTTSPNHSTPSSGCTTIRPLIYAHHSMQPTYAPGPNAAITADATATAIAYNLNPDWQAYLDDFVLASDMALESSSSSLMAFRDVTHDTNQRDRSRSSPRTDSSLCNQQQQQQQQQQGKRSIMHVMDPL
jgi:hypothetical protein